MLDKSTGVISLIPKLEATLMVSLEMFESARSFAVWNFNALEASSLEPDLVVLDCPVMISRFNSLAQESRCARASFRISIEMPLLDASFANDSAFCFEGLVLDAAMALRRNADDLPFGLPTNFSRDG